MARGAQNQAKQTFQESQNVFHGQGDKSQADYNALFPALTKEATNPQGYMPGDLAAMNTASQQSLGGATAGAVGEGDLAGARTRNAGSFAPALDESVRSGERQLSQDAVGIQGQNANLKQAQQQAGLQGLQGLYGTNTNAMLGALGLGNQSTQALTQAGQSGWFQNMTGLIAALKPGGSAAGGLSFGG